MPPLSTKIHKTLGRRGDSQVVIMLAFYSKDPRSNHTKVNNFSAKKVDEKNENKHKEAGVGALKSTLHQTWKRSSTEIAIINVYSIFSYL